VPISAVVVKSDTSAVSDVKVLEPSDDKIKHLKATRNSSVFCESGDKAKIRVIKTGIQDDTNIEVKTGLKGDVVITGPYTTVSKELNSNDMVYIKSESERKKASSFILE
jgi:HlyD family secretion protein